MAYQRATHPLSTPLAKTLGSLLQNWSIKSISRFPRWDFTKENSICVQYQSTSMSTLNHCLQVLICCICKWLPAPSRQQHEREASLSSPLLLLTMSIKLCKNEGLWKKFVETLPQLERQISFSDSSMCRVRKAEGLAAPRLMEAFK